MSNIIKSITTNHHVQAEYWAINNLKEIEDNNKTIGYSFNVSLYVNKKAFEAGAELLDNAVVEYTDFTRAEFTLDHKQAIAIRLTTPKPVTRTETLEDGTEQEVTEESNTISTSHSGQVTLVGGILDA